MTKVVFDISMSIDGYITASGITPEVPLGVGGERLHDWAFGGDPVNEAYLKRSVEGNGAVITGRVNYDASIPWWGADGPTGQVRRPVFVVTHAEPASSPDGGVYTFVTDGIEAALEKAEAAAGDLQVTIMGGAGSAAVICARVWSTRCRCIWYRSCSAAASGCSSTSPTSTSTCRSSTC